MLGFKSKHKQRKLLMMDSSIIKKIKRRKSWNSAPFLEYDLKFFAVLTLIEHFTMLNESLNGMETLPIVD